MANLITSFLNRQFIEPRVKEQVEGVERAQRGFSFGASPFAEISLRDSIGQPHDTDHPLLYGIYRMHVDVNGCVGKWVSGITARGWRITHMNPNAKPSAAWLKLVDETEVWLKNPNPNKPFSILIAEVVQNLGIAGDAFWNVTRDKQGRPLEIWPLHPSVTKVIADEHGAVSGYVQRGPNGKNIPFDAEEVNAFRRPNPLNDLYGESPLTSPLEDIGLDLQAMRSNRAIFANGMKPSAIAILDDKLTFEQAKEAAEMLKEKNVGTGHQHKLITFAGVRDLKTWTSTLKDMEFTALRELSTQKVTTAYGIPMLLLGYHNAGDYASSRILYREAHESTFKPNQEYIANIITESILHSIDPDLRFVFNEPDFADPEEKRKDFLSAEQRGIVTKNEVRTFALGLEPIDGLDDQDDPADGQATGNPDEEVDPEATDEAPEDVETPSEETKSVRKSLTTNELETIRTRREDTLNGLEAAVLPAVQTFFQGQESRYLDKLATSFKALPAGSGRVQVTKGVIDDLTDSYVQGIDGDTELGITLFAELETSAQAGADEAQLQIGITFNTDVVRQAVDDYLLKNALAHAKGINETTRDQIKDGLREGIAAGEGIPELRERIKRVFTEASTNRANVIARTETAQAFEAVNLAAMQASVVVESEQWLTAKDDRVRPEHRLREGLIVPIGTTWAGIRPGEEIQCRCTSIGILKEDDDGI